MKTIYRIIISVFFIFNALYLNAQKNLGYSYFSNNARELFLAKHLVQYAYENDDALALINAARIYYELGVCPLQYNDIKIVGEKVDSFKRTINSFDPVKLANDAEAMVKKCRNEPLIQLVQNVKDEVAVKKRGATDGPYCLEHTIIPAKGYTDVYLTLEGGKGTEIILVGNNTADIDLYLYDENEVLLASDEDNTDNCFITYTPDKEIDVKIKIKNTGADQNIYNFYLF